jgi:hypothetical protein
MVLTTTIATVRATGQVVARAIAQDVWPDQSNPCCFSVDRTDYSRCFLTVACASSRAGCGFKTLVAVRIVRMFRHRFPRGMHGFVTETLTGRHRGMLTLPCWESVTGGKNPLPWRSVCYSLVTATFPRGIRRRIFTDFSDTSVTVRIF